jgi:hypothetical protein
MNVVIGNTRLHAHPGFVHREKVAPLEQGRRERRVVVRVGDPPPPRSVPSGTGRLASVTCTCTSTSSTCVKPGCQINQPHVAVARGGDALLRSTARNELGAER